MSKRKMSILEAIKELNASEVEILPGANGNAFSGSRYLYSNIKVTPESTIASLKENNDVVICHKDSENKYESGGVILFNANNNKIELTTNELIDWINQKSITFKNIAQPQKRITKVVYNNNIESWKIGKFLRIHHREYNGAIYNEESLALEITGIDMLTLLKISEELLNVFNQDTLLIKVYSTGNIVLIHAK